MTYSGDPASSPLDAIRFWAQDTGTPPLLNDNELNYLITFAAVDPVESPQLAAALACELIASKYVGEVAISADGVSYSGQDLYTKWLQLAKDLRKSELVSLAATSQPYAGGITVGEIPDFTTKEPSFGIGWTDNPEAGDQSYGNNADYTTSYGADYEDQVGY